MQDDRRVEGWGGGRRPLQILAGIEAKSSSKGIVLLFTPTKFFRPPYDPAMVFLRKPHLVLQGPFNQHILQLSTIYSYLIPRMIKTVFNVFHRFCMRNFSVLFLLNYII